jgi:hypothetical protein
LRSAASSMVTHASIKNLCSVVTAVVPTLSLGGERIAGEPSTDRDQSRDDDPYGCHVAPTIRFMAAIVGFSR